MELPEEIVAKFRVLAQERLTRIEAEWAQVLSTASDDTVLHREVHTLKGESRMLGFTDVNTVAHKLEDLLEVARGSGYAVDEDFDLTVNMALRFMSMLVRKRTGAQLSGIDLPGFIRQIDSLLVEARPKLALRTRTGSLNPIKTRPRISPIVRDRMGPIAVDAFIEYAMATGIRRDRLRVSWHALREMLGLQRAAIGTGQLKHHGDAAKSLAVELGKEVFVVWDSEPAEVTSEVLAVVDLVVLHLIRNALDHGLEAPDVRVAAGKARAGKITIRSGLASEQFVLTVEDDGQGIDHIRVRDRAVEQGMWPPGVFIARDKLIDVLCMPGFSTRLVASEVSGRGVGLDAVRAGIADLGGVLSLVTEPGQGASWTMSVPVPTLGITGTILRVPNLPFPVVLDAAWARSGSGPARTLDVAAALGMAGGDGERHRFTRGGDAISIPCDRQPVTGAARRLIPTPDHAIGEVVVIDSVEGLLLRPERVS
jgi:signal transduction histidine kinase